MRIITALFMLYAIQSVDYTLGTPTEWFPTEIVPRPFDLAGNLPKMQAAGFDTHMATTSVKSSKVAPHQDNWAADESIPEVEELEELELSEDEHFTAPKAGNPKESSGVEQFSEEDNLHDELHAFQALVRRHVDNNHAACRDPTRNMLTGEQYPDSVQMTMAVEAVRKSAASGDGGDAFSMGFAYSKGIGVPQDWSQAIYWYQKSAAQKHQSAAVNLGVMYLQGNGVARSPRAAIQYFQQAVKLGSTHAMHILATIYQAQGNLSKAFSLFLQGAEAGDHHAAFSVGKAYANGRGVVHDLHESLRWLTFAAEAGNDNAQTNLGVAYMVGKGVAKNQQAAMKWFSMAAKQGNPSAQLNLGVSYLYGRGVVQNAANAAEWFLKAGNQGVKQAQVNLSILLRQGVGVVQDLHKAAHWANLAQQNKTAA